MAYKDKKQAMIMQNKWAAETYDRINLTVPKGQRATIKAHALSLGMSTNSFINQAITNEMAREGKKPE